MSKLALLTVFLLLSAGAANAAEAVKHYSGLAMHGQPKYADDAAHVDYVNPDAPKGGTLRMAETGTFDTLNPYGIKGAAAAGLNLVYDRLMARVWDEPFTLYPLIAKKAIVPKDRSSITFELDPRARFHDGSPITADDVIFSFETLRDHGRPNMRQTYRLVESAEKRGENTVHFSFKKGHDRETAMIVAMMPVLSKKYWSSRIASGKSFDSTTLEMPLLNGPYRITEFEPGRKIVYERVPDYWAADLLPNAGHYNFDKVIYEYYRDDSVAFEGFKSGNTDLRREWDAGKWAGAYDFPAVTSKKVALDSLPHGRPERVRAFIFNTRRAPFDDIRVRKAFDLLLDFEWANANLFHGQYKRIESYFPNAELAATGTPDALQLGILEPWKDKLPPEVFGPAYKAPVSGSPEKIRANMRAADALLKEAGWGVENGKRVKNGKPLQFEILLGTPGDEKLTLHFRRALEKMGIFPTIRVLDQAAYRGRLNEYDFDMTLYFWLSSLSPGTEQPLYWGCKAAKEPGRWNYAGICNQAIDSIAGSIAASTSREDLVARVRTLDRILMHGHYMIPLYYVGTDYVAYWKPLRHPEKTPLYGTVLETWWMDMPPGTNGH